MRYLADRCCILFFRYKLFVIGLSYFFWYYSVTELSEPKGIKKGSASLIMAHVEKGKGIETAIEIKKTDLYVDENNMLSLITVDEAMYLSSK